ncbi:V-type ATP synthase subunit I [Flagellimonas meridianipacifica]|uniref:V/A-type H+-transporting ATPase subunit I n=1 Tax=Flagellimonas meridianipacifica TaxID=1080225 RepID=A0A2T0MD61_9FLAO|nr:V-type ATPase 116kDa subunit family protein [Allomuricauda pacifica]PRX55412.1 V/A-type H+-transporting ATPase subunit I [Allomuricauda pacifica]
MIVKMKEIVLFTTARSADEAILKLGELGVVDIQEINLPMNGILERRTKAFNRSEMALRILKEHIKKKKGARKRIKYVVRDPKQLVDRILKTAEIRQKCQERLDDLNHQLDWYNTWGEKVNVKDIYHLQKKGLYLRLYLLEKSMANSLGQKYTLVKLQEVDGKILTVLITQDETEKLDHREEPLPKLPFEDVKQQLLRKNRQLAEVEHFLKDQTENIKWLEEYQLLLKDQAGIQQALEAMGDVEGKLKYLKGYIPKNTVVDFVATAKENHWGYHIVDPEKPEEVPVYIKNPKWISIINPIMKFIDIIPGYKEVDVSIYFLVTFALFFAMLVGDAGYGFIFLLFTFLLRKKLSGQMRVLIYVLSGATIIWGVLSGTYFGSEQIAALPILNNLIIPQIASFGVDNISFMMHLSFLIGAIHLTVAHGIRVVQYINSIKALSEVGWIALVWGLFLITEQLVLGQAMPEWGPWLFIGGGVLVALFSMESKNIFKSMGVSLANLPLSLISGFSDIVSYVRLFAVGMATAAVAASFNNMILPEGISGMGIVNLLMAAIALLLGHGLNIALALMAVMVHGIRLNMLEFAGHLGVQFSGEAYKPFRLISSKHLYNDGKPFVPNKYDNQ